MAGVGTVSSAIPSQLVSSSQRPVRQQPAARPDSSSESIIDVGDLPDGIIDVGDLPDGVSKSTFDRTA